MCLYHGSDLSPPERGKEKKLREELKARRESGESNIIIRDSRIITRPTRDNRTNTGIIDSDTQAKGGSSTETEPHDTLAQVSDTVTRTLSPQASGEVAGKSATDHADKKQ